jgi:hypothetical protein
VHWNAHPICQLAAVMVKGGLVQGPWDWVGPTRTRVGEAGCDVVVDEDEEESVELVVVDDPEGEVVVEDPDGEVVVVLPVAPPPAAEVVVVGRAKSPPPGFEDWGEAPTVW